MFKNPNYTDPGAVRFVKYKPFIDAFLAELPAEKAEFDFADIRAWAAVHPDPTIPPLVVKMSDGVLADLCQRAAVERA